MASRDMNKSGGDEDPLDFMALYKRLANRGATAGSARRTFESIRRDLEERLRSDPRKVVTEILDMLLVTTMELVLRNKVALDRELRKYDEKVRDGFPMVPEQSLPLIERLEAQQRSLLELLSLRARTLHTMRLAEQGSAHGDQEDEQGDGTASEE